MRKISVVGVLAGASLDMILTLLVALPFYVWITADPAIATLPSVEQWDAVAAVTYDHLWLYASQLLLGSVCSVAGGYVAAMIAKRGALLNGALSGSFCFFMGLYGLMKGTDGIPWWLHILFLPLGPALGALGGAWWSKRSEHAAQTGAAPKLRAPVWRRVLFIVLYGIGGFLLLSVLMALLMPRECLEAQECSPQETAMTSIIGWLFLMQVLCVIVAGAAGWLPGARNRSRDPSMR